ncbi:MAG: polysaccharide deacetylase family protein [Anaerolineae bacterium]
MLFALVRISRLAGLVVLFLVAGLVNLHCGAINSPVNSSLNVAALAAIPTEPPATVTAVPTDTPTLIPTSTDTPPPTDTSTPTPTETSTSTPTVTATPTRRPTLAPTLIPGRAARIPILMFHHVSVLPPDADALRIDLTVPPDVFDAEMKWLSSQGYHTIHLADVVNYFQTDAPLPPKPIVLTFDDGYDDNYLNVYPTLKDYGFNGAFFIITGRADSSAYGYMTWAQIQEMAANGMEIGSHSVDHRYDLGKMSKNVQWAEIKPAQEDLARHLPNAPLVFSYPSGSYNATTLDDLTQLGYIAAVTTRSGAMQYAVMPLELRRVRIRGPWSAGEFAFWVDYWTKGG